jgi:hypothetical protein
MSKDTQGAAASGFSGLQEFNEQLDHSLKTTQLFLSAIALASSEPKWVRREAAQAEKSLRKLMRAMGLSTLPPVPVSTIEHAETLAGSLRKSTGPLQ